MLWENENEKPIEKQVSVVLLENGKRLDNVKQIIFKKSVIFEKPKKMLVWCDKNRVIMDDVLGVFINRPYPIITTNDFWQYCAEIPENLKDETNWDRFAKVINSECNTDHAIEVFENRPLSCVFCPASKFCENDISTLNTAGCIKTFANWAKKKA